MSKSNVGAGVLMMAAGCGVAGYFLVQVMRAIHAGYTVGRLGLHNSAPSSAYYVSVSFMFLGIALGMGCLYMGWCWTRPAA